MRLLETWIANPFTSAIGWTLLHSLWEGAIVAAVLAGTLPVMRSSRDRYAAAWAALLLILLACGITFFRVAPENAYGLAARRAPALLEWKVRNNSGTGDLETSIVALAVPWLVPLWLSGTVLFYTRDLAGWIAVRRLRRRGVCCAAERWQEEIRRLSDQLKLTRSVFLLESCLANIPIVVGHFRPLILMPIGLLTGLPSGQVEAILLHELAHIRRHDYLMNMMQRCIEGALFYHPAVWWISRLIRAERENCCDDEVVAVRGDAHEYAIALTALEESRCLYREPAVAATGGNLAKRIHRLLYPKRTAGIWTSLLAAGILFSSVVVPLAAWQAAPSQHNSASVDSPANSSNTKYSKWLNEDVVYIIHDDERAAFDKLATNEEKDMFIQQFWLRRDSTPGTEENEFKEEHYRRLAYANKHFASARPGWQTDRGHMYIIYGPPDEIDSHPHGAPNRFPYEDWRYRHVEGIGDDLFFTFVDQSGQGDYKLAPSKAS